MNELSSPHAKVRVWVVYGPAPKGSRHADDVKVAVFRYGNRDGADTLAHHTPGGYVVPDKMFASDVQ